MRLINRHPSRSGGLMLLLLPFIVLVAIYFTGSSLRLKVNPDDKLLPSATQMSDAIKQVEFTEDKRTGEYLLWDDTVSSLRRHGIGCDTAGGCNVVAVHYRAFHDPTARGAAYLVHRVRARRVVEGRADRDRHYADDHPRPAVAHARDSGGIVGKGADPGCYKLDAD